MEDDNSFRSIMKSQIKTWISIDSTSHENQKLRVKRGGNNVIPARRLQSVQKVNEGPDWEEVHGRGRTRNSNTSCTIM